MTQKGYDVYTIPEAPTIFALSGGKYPGTSPEKHAELVEYENILFRFQTQLEDAITQLTSLQHQKTAIVLYDRALFDIKAYVSSDIWEELLRLNNLNDATIRERYDMVAHLVTAADGAESFYTLANNAARIEDASLARHLDSLTRSAWQDHPEQKIITNEYGSFQGKLDVLLKEVEKFVQKKTSIFRNFL